MNKKLCKFLSIHFVGFPVRINFGQKSARSLTEISVSLLYLSATVIDDPEVFRSINLSVFYFYFRNDVQKPTYVKVFK